MLSPGELEKAFPVFFGASCHREPAKQSGFLDFFCTFAK